MKRWDRSFEKFRRFWLLCATKRHFLLATAVHIVKLASIVAVLAWTTIVFVPRRVFQPLGPTDQDEVIVAIAPVEDVLATISGKPVVAVAPGLISSHAMRKQPFNVFLVAWRRISQVRSLWE
jgi:hypothetical protein